MLYAKKSFGYILDNTNPSTLFSVAKKNNKKTLHAVTSKKNKKKVKRT